MGCWPKASNPQGTALARKVLSTVRHLHSRFTSFRTPRRCSRLPGYSGPDTLVFMWKDLAIKGTVAIRCSSPLTTIIAVIARGCGPCRCVTKTSASLREEAVPCDSWPSEARASVPFGQLHTGKRLPHTAWTSLRLPTRSTALPTPKKGGIKEGAPSELVLENIFHSKHTLSSISMDIFVSYVCSCTQMLKAFAVTKRT